MARNTFYSFYYKLDSWRVSKVRNIGAVVGNKPAKDNDWEEIQKGGDPAIQKWIDSQFKGKSVAIVLIGEKTAGRKWIKYEIEKAWDSGKGVLGIHIHNLTDQNDNQSQKGSNPFGFKKINQQQVGLLKYGGTPLSSIVNAYDPPRATSKGVYKYIEDNISKWIEKAIEIRGQHE